MELEPRLPRGSRVYEKIVAKLRAAIAKDELLPGDPLPAERQLMEDLEVSRSSLREAFRVMELLGLIESVPGKGRFVRQPLSTAGDGKSVKLEDSAILELMEARRVLDPAIASAAAAKARPGDVTKLLRIVAETEKVLGDADGRAKFDFEFHLALAEASHNFVFINITHMNFDLIMSTHDRIYNMLGDKDEFLSEHKALCEAIRDSDPEKARAAASRHIDRIFATLDRSIAAGPSKQQDASKL